MLINNISTSGLINFFSLALPPSFTLNNETENNLFYFFSGIAEAFKINLQQINELYNKTKISLMSGNDVDAFVLDHVSLRRKQDESDEEYLQRYIKRVYVYNCNDSSIIQQVYDITGFEPELILELNARNTFWGKANTRNDERKHYFYDNGYKAIWGRRDVNNAFTGYIYLTEKPPTEMLEELISTLKQNQMSGTKIYLRYPVPVTVVETPESESPSDITYDSFVANWS